MSLLTHPDLAALRRATPDPATLGELAMRAEEIPLACAVGRRIMSYGITRREGMDTSEPALWKGALQVGALVNLKHLSVHSDNREGGSRSAGSYGGEHFEWLWNSPLGKQLETLDVVGYDSHPLVSWLPVIQQAPVLKRLTLRFTNSNTAAGTPNLHSVFVLERDSNDAISLRLQLNWAFQDELRYFSSPRQWARSLAGFPHAELPNLALEYTGSKKVDFTRYSEIAEYMRDKFDHVALPTSRSLSLAPAP